MHKNIFNFLVILSLVLLVIFWYNNSSSNERGRFLMRFSKEDLAKMVVELIDNVCNYHVNCFESQQKCPLYQNCGFWSEVKLEIQDWLNVGGEDKMQFSKEELAEIIVNMYHDVCDNCADCNKCPLSANCEYYTSISIELEKFALEEAIS